MEEYGRRRERLRRGKRERDTKMQEEREGRQNVKGVCSSVESVKRER